MIGVDAAAHAGLAGHFIGIDHVEVQFLFDDVFLHFLRQVIPNFFGTIDAVEQENPAGRQRTWVMSNRSRKLNWWQATKLAPGRSGKGRGLGAARSAGARW